VNDDWPWLKRYRLVVLSPLYETPPRKVEGAMICPKCAGTGKTPKKRRQCRVCAGLGVVMVGES